MKPVILNGRFSRNESRIRYSKYGCGFTLYGSNWYGLRGGRQQQFYATPIAPAVPPAIAKWMEDLEKLVYPRELPISPHDGA